MSDYGKLKTYPKGFPSDFIGIETLKHKHYVVGKHFQDEEIIQGGFLKKISRGFNIMHPFIEFLNEAIEYHSENQN